MKYNILRTDKFNDQLYDIIHYIDGAVDNVEIALNYLEKIEKAIMALGNFPYSGSKPRYSILRKQGFRVLIVEKHIMFYKVQEKEMTVIMYAVVDSRREYKNLI